MTSELGAERVELAKCAGCGIEGMKADTTAGEVIEAGEVVGIVPEGITPLLVGRSDGSEPDGLYCEACAQEEPERVEPDGDHGELVFLQWNGADWEPLPPDDEPKDPVRLVIDDAQRAETYPLYMHYEGQTNPQDAFLQMDAGGEVTASYNPEVGNGVLEGVAMRRVLRWPIPNRATVAEIESLFEMVRPALQRIHDGHEIGFDGANRVGVFSYHARSADHAMDDLMEGFRQGVEEGGHYANHPEDWPADE